MRFSTRRPRRKHVLQQDTTDSTTLREEEDSFDIRLSQHRNGKCNGMTKTMTTASCRSYAYMSNHVVVNNERKKRNIPLLTRCAILDEMARGKAQEMANQLKTLTPYESDSMVENVHRTSSLQIMHQLVMHGADTTENNLARQNILDPRFVKFGMASVKGKDGMIYVSQLFQGLPPTSSTYTNTKAAPAPIKNPRSRNIPALRLDIDPANLSRKK